MNKAKFTLLFSVIFYFSSAIIVGVSNAGATDFEERRARGIATLSSLTGQADASQMAANWKLKMAHWVLSLSILCWVISGAAPA